MKKTAIDMRTYRARSMQEAIELVRHELGPDASILHVREVRDGMLRWVGGGRKVEVTASATIDAPPRFDREAGIDVKAASQPLRSNLAPNTVVSRERKSLVSVSAAEPGAPVRVGARMFGETGAIGDLTDPVAHGYACVNTERADLHPPPGRDAEFDGDTRLAAYAALLEAEWSDIDARALLDQWSGSDGVSLEETFRQLQHLVADCIPISGAIRTAGGRRVVALVGPTGVGKTTTIAKLAANFQLRDQLQVGLITVDTYRIAAVAQLQTYANIIDLPMRVVGSPQEMREAVDAMADLDLILMDTAGRSPKDETKIRELRSLFEAAPPDEVHLVMSSASSVRGLTQVASQFKDAGVTSLILTKLDEAEGLGGLWPLLRETQIPVSYLTHGQNVPDDIRVASANLLARRMLDREASLG